MTETEESKKGKRTQDIRIVGWLYGFTRPYRTLMAAALVFMILSALLELSVPYITKIAVDRYIYPSWGIAVFKNNETDKKFEKAVTGKYASSLIPLGGSSYLIDLSGLDNADRNNLEKLGMVPKDRYLVIKPDDINKAKLARVNEIMNRNKGLFKKTGGIFYISYRSLKELDRDNLLVIRSDEIKDLIIVAALLFACLTGIFVFSSVFTYLLNYSGHKIMHRMRTDIFSHILSLPQTFFDKNPVGRLTTRVTNDVNAINEMYTSVAVQFFKDVLVVIGVFVVMFYLNRELTLFVALFTVLMIFFAGLFRMKLKTVYRDVRRSIAKLNAFVQESVRGIVLIKLYNREMENFEKFRETNEENFKANMDQLWVYATFRPFIEFMSVFTVAFILWYGGLSVLKLELTLGALIAYLYYVRMLFRPIMELAEKYNIFQSASVASENLYELMNIAPEEKSGITEAEVKGRLEFRNVWFSYNDKDWVLKDVSFTINPGETVALVGLTGSGKSTIVNLILKFYNAQKGQILFDGRDIREIRPEFLRGNISAVFQDLFLFGKNISDSEDDGFSKAIEMDQIKSNGTTISSGISSGEKQLVSLGQAFSKNAKFLILDEATSNIDARIERNIKKALKHETGDRTTLIIAHRLSNVSHADRIMVIHKGEISEVGTHSSLLARKGIYYNLYELQNEIHRFSFLSD
ncbi:MAG: ABC transporter ATP-binding protein [Thermodesulfobacteriota bacterium]